MATENQITYKCPCCGGAIEFDSSIQKLKCPYCDTEFEAETLRAYDEELKSTEEDSFDRANVTDKQWSDDDNMSIYTCKSCGGEIVADETTAATICPFCDNPVVLSGRLSGDLFPDMVIPFKVDKKAAKSALSRHFSGKKLLPKIFKDENHLDEIKGVYIPYWFFDGDVDASIRYKATRTRAWSNSRYNFVETSHFLVTRKGNLSFDNVPSDGSSKFDDTVSESIEPFDFGQAVDFATSYLSGYYAERYDVSSDDCLDRVKSRMKVSTEKAFADTVNGYSSVRAESSTVKVSNSNVRYLLCPVWILNTTWNNEKYPFFVNGQTGKIVGNLPLDKGAFAKWLFGLTGIAAAACALIGSLMWLIGM